LGSSKDILLLKSVGDAAQAQLRGVSEPFSCGIAKLRGGEGGGVEDKLVYARSLRKLDSGQWSWWRTKRYKELDVD
jgi:hypothetical protein